MRRPENLSIGKSLKSAVKTGDCGFATWQVALSVLRHFDKLGASNSMASELCGASESGCSSAWLERLVRDQEAGGSNPLSPTIFRNEPFGENVEGLSQYGD